MQQDLTARASQTVALDEAWEPVLSLWYQPGPATGDPAPVFNIRITMEPASDNNTPVLSETLVFTPNLGASGWQHLAYRLGQAGKTFTGEVTVELKARAAEGTSGTIVYMDEVSLGSGPGGRFKLLLPLARREADSP
jgi:hypothetical protein